MMDESKSENRKSVNYYVADTHFGHESILRFDDRPFRTIREHDETLIENWNSVVTDVDHVYILGDFCFRNDRPASFYADRLKGRLHLIRGNHDKRTAEYESCFETVDDIRVVSDAIDGQKVRVVMCHYWIPFYGQKKIMLHGHTHTGDEFVLEEMLKWDLAREDYPRNAYNVGVMHLGYFPRTLSQIVGNKRQ